ncbi:MAG: Fic family protein [Segetibacter sp.]|nr:Fic family protein [Segetibacter sp.]
MQILSEKYFESYRQQLKIEISKAMAEIDAIELTSHSFTFYTSVAVISSSRIEGEQMEIDSYVKHKTQNIEYLPELVEKPNDLYTAYLFAKENKLTLKNFLQSHLLLSQHLLPEKWRGVYRRNEMLVMEHSTGRIQFEAAPFNIVEEEINKLWRDIEKLKESELSAEEVFYYASFIHIVFVNIHPFNDGNGRAGRLLEKWFLAELLGEKAWYIKSEKYYYRNVNDYYKNLNRLGMFYDKVDYEKALPFLLMLPNAIDYKE